MQPHELAVLVQSGRGLALRDRPVEVVRHVLLPAPDHLDRDAGKLLRDGDGLAHVVLRTAAPAEAAAQDVLVDLALLERQPRRLGERGERGLAILCGDPCFRAFRRDPCRAVHRLHRRVREEGRRVDGLDFLRGAADCLQRVAFLPHPVGDRRGEPFLEMRRDRRAGLRRSGAFVPDDRQRVERGLRSPPRIGDDGDGRLVDPDGAGRAGPAGDLRFVEAHELAAEDRTILDGGAAHPRQLDVDRIDELAVELHRGVEPLHRLAGDLPVLRVLELDRRGVGRGKLGRRRRDLAVGHRALRGGMRDDAVRHGELADRDFPLVGRRLQQHHSRCRAALPHIVLRRADAAAAARAHLAPRALPGEALARRRKFGRHLRPVALELLDDELREAGHRALAHLRAGDADHAAVVRLDDDPRVDLGRVGSQGRGFDAAGGDVDPERQGQAQREPAARHGGRADDEPAARQARRFRLVRRFHEPPPGVAAFGALAPAAATFMPAAMWTAARIR